MVGLDRNGQSKVVDEDGIYPLIPRPPQCQSNWYPSTTMTTAAARQAIQSGRCEYIQQYHESGEYLKPSEDQPMIESIRFIAGEKLDEIVSPYKGSK